MTDLEIFALLRDETPFNHPAWPVFKAEMSGCRYGRDALNQAWYFFKTGFEAGSESTRR